jgi:hypothetical protein
MKEVPGSKESAFIDLKDYPSSLYKFVIQGRSNSVNRWLIIDEEKKAE